MKPGYSVHFFLENEAMVDWLDGLAKRLPDSFRYTIQGVWSTPAGIYVLIHSWDYDEKS